MGYEESCIAKYGNSTFKMGSSPKFEVLKQRLDKTGTAFSSPHRINSHSNLRSKSGKKMVRDIEDEIVLLDSPYLGETVEEISSVSEKISEQCDDGDNAFKSAPNIFHYDHVPPKKRHYLWTSDTCRSFEWLNEHACIVCDLANDCVVPCSGNDCPLAVHRKCAELYCEDPEISYCPYCWFRDQATRSMTSRTVTVAAAKALLRYGCTKLKSGDIVMARENIQLENGSDKSLPMQLHENLHKLREVVEQLKARNLRLDGSACGEDSVVVCDQPKRVLWTVEEENMLRVGVETFSSRINKNMPWKKILEMGKDVFHQTRNSSDLKDKWRKSFHKC